MDWKIFLSALTTIFLAELGDKTQLASLCLAAESRSVLSVFLGAMAAFSLVTVITVILGGAWGKLLRPEIVRYIAATLFVAIGLLMFAGKL
ncbi:MAG TPA: TMEM165/GDT1 family protein [bacterium]|nr:TMEM165/GDT1 family protein [bacterium]HPP12336.1 TMEM165/GDT1 family protein [bacterium]